MLTVMKTKLIIACFFMCLFDYSMKGQDTINKHMFSEARVSLINSSPYYPNGAFYLVNDSSIMLFPIDIKSVNTVFSGDALGIPAGIDIGTDQSAKNPSYFFDGNWVPAAGDEIPGGEIDPATGVIRGSFGIRILLRGSMDK